MIPHRQLFLQHIAQTTNFPLMLETDHTESIYMYAPDGKKYRDLISGTGVGNMAARYPKVIEASKFQIIKV